MGKYAEIAVKLKEIKDRWEGLKTMPNITRRVMESRIQRKFEETKAEYDRIGKISLFKVRTSHGVVFLGDIELGEVYPIIEQMNPNASILEIYKIDTKRFLSGEKIP